MNAATVMLAAALTLPSNVLVLRSGQRIDIDTAREDNGRIVFRAASGGLYSLPIEEIAPIATDIAPATRAVAPVAAEPESPLAGKKLKVTADERKRLIAALEQNHSGEPVPVRAITLPPPPPPLEQQTEEEWSWRRRARSFEEMVRQAKENRDLLVSRADALRSHILSLLSLGYKARQFTYDTTQLQLAIEQIPQANLEVVRAERAFSEFREEARQRDIMPGWVR
jgi:hypothetical protein